VSGRRWWTRVVRGGHSDPARSALPAGRTARPTAAPARPADGPALPRSIEDLLEDMRALRLTLVADLSAAAAAVEDDCDRVAADIIDSDRRELAALMRRSTARLQGDAEVVPATGGITVPPARTWRRRALISLPAVPLVGALAMSAAAAAGLLPLPTHGHTHARVLSERPVSTTFRQFETVLDGDPSASQVVAAASAFHQQIAAMLANARQSPDGVTEVAQLLQLEQALLMRKQPPGSNLVLAQSRKLAARLLTVARAASAQPTPATVATPSASSSPKRSTSPKSSSSTSPTAKSSTTKPVASSSPSPTSSSSSSGAPDHLPSVGG
jgi:hypothetical protein